MSSINKYRTVVSNESFKKPDLDKRQYRIIRLDNQLEALLINDPDAKKGGAALDVNVGSVNDPKGLPGLAHFCEHLLFMGTKKYPEENEYSKFLSENSGSSNAYTSSYNTNYYFEVDVNHLEGAIDRFAQFFISPLFSDENQDREINIIHSEHAKNIENDVWRLQQLRKNMGNPEHPHTNFSTGNLETLRDLPSKNGIDPRAELLKWYGKYYSSNIMKVCVFGSQSLDELSELTAKYFSDVQNLNVDIDQVNIKSKEIPYLTKNQLQKYIKVKPVKNMKNIRLQFYIPMPEDEAFRNSPHSIISHLIGHESEGSILHYLKIIKNWATLLSSSTITMNDNQLFEVNIELTKKGEENLDSIIKTVFQYIYYLKSSSDDEFQKVYSELVDVAKLNFKFKENSSNIMNSISSFASNMSYKFIRNDSEKKDFLCFYYFFNKKYDFQSIETFLSYLTPENLNLYFIDTNVSEDELLITDHFYGTKYNVESIDKGLIQSLDQKLLGKNNYLHLPPLPNPFITKHFAINNANAGAGTSQRRPLLIAKDSTKSIWFKADDRFSVPKGCIFLLLSFPGSTDTVIDSIYLSILRGLLKLKLNSLRYLADSVELKLSIDITNSGLEIQVSGYNEKLISILEQAVNNITDFLKDDAEFRSADNFELVRNHYIKTLKNVAYSIPYKQALIFMSTIFHINLYDFSSKLHYLIDANGEPTDEYINFDNFNAYLKLSVKQLQSQILIFGNFKKEAILASVENLVDKEIASNFKPIRDEVQSFGSRSCLLPKGTHNYFTREVNHLNSCISYFIQFGELQPMINDLYHCKDKAQLTLGKEIIAAEFLAHYLHEPFFNQLRTKEQLGYIVFVSEMRTSNSTGLRILVQSNVASCAYLESRIVNCINTVAKKLIAELNDEVFDSNMQALKTNWINRLNYKNLNQEINTYFNAIDTGYWGFFNNEQKIIAAEHITKQDVLDVFNKYVIKKEDSSRLTVHLQGTTEFNQPLDGTYHDIAEGEHYPEGKKITHVGNFKKSVPLSAAPVPVEEIEYYKSY